MVQGDFDTSKSGLRLLSVYKAEFKKNSFVNGEYEIYIMISYYSYNAVWLEFKKGKKRI